MRIESLAVAFPSREVTNAGVLNEIASHSRGFEGNLDRMLEKIDVMLRRSGSNTRRWRAPGETSLELTKSAYEKAVSEIDERPVDLLICAGVYAELAEPSSANIVAHAIGLDEVECFDVKQACDGWSKAIAIASAFIGAGIKRRVAIVNAEFPMTEGFGIHPQLFRLDRSEQLEYRFPGYTLGEAAAVTILGPDRGGTWRFHNKSRNDLWDLCTITMPWHGGQPLGSPRVAKDGPAVFTSYGMELRKHGLPAVVETFRESGVDTGDVDILFTHSSSRSDWHEAAVRIGLANKIFDIYHEFGNVVSAAVPAAMGVAKERSVLKRGMRIDSLVASAGMSFTNIAFQY